MTPDVILLQEVEQALPGGMQVQPPPNYGRLREEFPGYDAFFSYPKADPRELPFGIGLAIFSRTPLREMQRVNLPSPPIEFEFFGKKTTPTDRLLIGARTFVAGREVQFSIRTCLRFSCSDRAARRIRSNAISWLNSWPHPTAPRFLPAILTSAGTTCWRPSSSSAGS